jgi:hypothetical protein
MDWMRRIGRTAPPSPPPPEPRAAAPEAFVGAAPGVAALLDGVDEDGTHAVLDLGPASSENFRVYGRYSRRMRFADLLAAATTSRWSTELAALPCQPDRPYDLIFGWDILDRLPAEGRGNLVERLVQLSAPGARLHVVVEAAEGATTRPLHFTLVDVDRVRYQPTGPARPPRPRLLPADVERLLAPFQVTRAFTLKAGLREYVAVRSDA